MGSTSNKSRMAARRRAVPSSKSPLERHQEATAKATDQIRGLDAFQNLVARLGVGSTNLLEGTQYPLTRITRQYMLMQALYRNNWVAQRIADTYPELMCKVPPVLTCQVPPKDLAQFYRVVEKSGIWRKLEWTMKLANVFGGAGAVIVIKGQENYLDEPLYLDDVRPDSFRGIVPFDRWSGINPGGVICNDVNRPLDYGLPESYIVTTATGGTFNIHASRVLRFTGRDLQLWEQQSEMWWGESLFEASFEEIKKRDNMSFNIISLMFRAQLLGMKIPGLEQIISGVGMNAAATQQFNRTWQAQSELMSNQGIMLFGENGGLDSHQYTFGGMSEIYHEMMKDVAASADVGIPYEILFGRDSGLGSNGESSLQLMYDRTAHKQKTKLDPALQKLYPVIAMSTWGEVPDDFAWKYPTARTMSNKEQAELADALTKPVIEAFNAGLISQQTSLKEFQQNSKVTEVFSNVTDKDVAAADDKVQQPMEMGGGAEGESGEGAEFGQGEKGNAGSPHSKQPRPAGGKDSFDLPIYGGAGSRKRAKDANHPGGTVESEMFRRYGLDIVIETPKGRRRRGKWWRWTMPYDYGYIAATTGADGDEMDCYVGDDATASTVYVVDQSKLHSRRFDEHKCFLGFPTEQSARQAYIEGHTDGAAIFLGITAMSMDRFKQWLASGNTRRPLLRGMDSVSCASCEDGTCLEHTE
jgi:phage-related protein (TIGR01555 family)